MPFQLLLAVADVLLTGTLQGVEVAAARHEAALARVVVAHACLEPESVGSVEVNGVGFHGVSSALSPEAKARR